MNDDGNKFENSYIIKLATILSVLLIIYESQQTCGISTVFNIFTLHMKKLCIGRLSIFPTITK